MKLSRRRFLPALALAASAPALARAQALPVSGLIMGTGRPGGDYPLYGPAWGRFAAAQAGLNIAYRETGGAQANILLIDEGTAQLGLTSGVVAHEAITGTSGWTAGAKISSFSLLFPTYVSVLQIIAPPGGPTQLANLTGLTIGIGPGGGSVAVTAADILALLGVTPKQIITGDVAPQMSDMLAGHLDACAFIGAPPLKVISHAAMTHKLSLIGFSGAECGAVAKVLPGFREVILPPGLFPGLNVPVSTLGTDNYAICARYLPNEITQPVTQAALANRAKLAGIIPAAGTPPPLLGASALGLKFHPGAAAALRLSGARIDDADIG